MTLNKRGNENLILHPFDIVFTSEIFEITTNFFFGTSYHSRILWSGEISHIRSSK